MMIQTNRIFSKSTIMIYLLALTHGRFCNSFSISSPFSLPPSTALSLAPSSSSSDTKEIGVQIANVDPLILALSNVLSSHDIKEMLDIIQSYEEFEDEGGDDPGKGQGLIPTDNYQEDVFSKEAAVLEDEHFLTTVSPLLEANLIPEELFQTHDAGSSGVDGGKRERDSNAPMRMFVYAVTQPHLQELLPEEDIIKGANALLRRQALERWQSEAGQVLLNISNEADNDDTDDHDVIANTNVGQRYQMPPELLSRLQKNIVPRILKGGMSVEMGQNGINDECEGNDCGWSLRDATIVKYQEGNGQPPHLDPCDATILLCLRESGDAAANESSSAGGDDDSYAERAGGAGNGGGGGGDTCFPMLDISIENKAGDGLLFFSSNTIFGDPGRNVSSLHHGGRVRKGSKIVVQLMLDWTGLGSDSDSDIGIDTAETITTRNNNNGMEGCEMTSWLDLIACV